MHIKVDQSGKVEDTATDTVIAFSNEKKRAVLIPTTVKRNCLQELRREGKTGKSIYRRMFVTGLFFLLKNEVKKHDLITIDIEYVGHSRSIKEHLLDLLANAGIKLSPDDIRFERIGKKSPAHDKAYYAHRGDVKADKTIGEEELLKYLR
jgi:hypothetical protein